MADQNNAEEVLAIQRELLSLSKKRTHLSEKRTKEALRRTEESLKRTEESIKRTRESYDRTVMSAKRIYMNAERTLSVWVRTALSAMVFGIAIERFGFLVKRADRYLINFLGEVSRPTAIIGAVLVLFSVVMALSAGWRFVRFSKQYRKKFQAPHHHSTWLPASYAFMVVFFGIGLFILMWKII